MMPTKKNRISDLEIRLEEIKQEALESEKYTSKLAFFDRRKEIPRYSSGLVTSDKYYPKVYECFEEKVKNDTSKLEMLNKEKLP